MFQMNWQKVVTLSGANIITSNKNSKTVTKPSKSLNREYHEATSEKRYI
jgi:hypothetical protein